MHACTHVSKQTQTHIHTCTQTKAFPLGQSIRQKPLYGDADAPLHKVEKKCSFLHSVFLILSFQHVCPDLLQVTSPNGVKLRPRGQELSSGHKHPCFRTGTLFVFHCSVPVPLPQAQGKGSHLTASYRCHFLRLFRGIPLNHG